MRPEDNFGIKRDSEISAYVVNKEMVTSRNDFDKHMQTVNKLRTSVDEELTGATTLHQNTYRNSLYSTIINNNHALESIRRSHKQSPIVGLSPPHSSKNRSPHSKFERWNKDGEVSSVNHLIKDTIS